MTLRRVLQQICFIGYLKGKIAMDIMVSIVCNTFNHERYIEDALNGFVSQETSFPFEVLVHDDASTDATPELINYFAMKFPTLIHPIYQKENQYSKGIDISGTFQIPRAKGKYIAICEGDDFWTDNKKLQKQFEVLENHFEIDMCAHRAEEIDGLTGKHNKWIAPINKDGILPTISVVRGGGAFLATASLFYRKELETRMPKFRMLYKLDYTLQLAGALRGGIYYLNDSMSKYRFLTPGSWTVSMANDIQKKIIHKEMMRKVLTQINEDTGYKYRKDIGCLIAKNVITRGLLLLKSHILK